eukprot:3020994-Rhodomonas_salina.1
MAGRGWRLFAGQRGELRGAGSRRRWRWARCHHGARVLRKCAPSPASFLQRCHTTACSRRALVVSDLSVVAGSDCSTACFNH